MTDTKKVETAINDLSRAIASDDDELAKGALTVLVGGVVLDLNRIANAVEKLAITDQFANAAKMAMENGPSGVTELVSLTTEERETIEALRRGEIHVIKGPGPVTGSDTHPTVRLCPVCKAPLTRTERRPDGDSYCSNGHKFKTTNAITR